MEERRTYDYPALAEIIRDHGYDGIIYTNAHEDAGSDSVVILSSKQALTGEPEIITLLDALRELGIPEEHYHD